MQKTMKKYSRSNEKVLVEVEDGIYRYIGTTTSIDVDSPAFFRFDPKPLVRKRRLSSSKKASSKR